MGVSICFLLVHSTRRSTCGPDFAAIIPVSVTPAEASVIMFGAGGSAIASPMKKPGCGGWL
jgi:hypothetical protein